MTRKKFIKQLGRYGITRNTANGMAEIARQQGATYEQAWAHFLVLIDELKRRVKDAITHAILYGEGTAEVPGPCAYFPFYNPTLDFEIKPLSDPPPWRYLYAIDTALVEPEPVILFPKINPQINPHLDGYSAKVHIVDEMASQGGGGHE